MKQIILVALAILLTSCGLISDLFGGESEPSVPPDSLIELTATIHLAALDNFNEGLILSPPQWAIPDTLGAYQYFKADGTYAVDSIMDKPEDNELRFIGTASFAGYPVLDCTFYGEQAFTQVACDNGKVMHDSHSYLTVVGSEFVDLYLSIHWQHYDSTGFFGVYGIVEADGVEYDLVDLEIF